LYKLPFSLKKSPPLLPANSRAVGVAVLLLLLLP
jgi:hypothetical protein